MAPSTSGRNRSASHENTDSSGALSQGGIMPIIIIFAILVLCVIARLVWVQVVDAQTILDRGNSRDQVVPIQSQRGTIYDRNGVVLATSQDAANIFCHPHVVSDEDAVRLAAYLVEYCGGKVSDYNKLIKSNQNFSYLAKGVDTAIAKNLMALGLEGVDYEKTSIRVYPCGSAGSQVIGVLNSEGEAVSGLELYYDNILRGNPGSKTIRYSKEGVPVPGYEVITEEAVAGEDIVVSIDVGLQERVETELEARAKEIGGTTGAGIVMDAATGDIYACASYPFFDITDLAHIKEGATNLNGISNVFEPGSVLKPAAMLAALEAGAIDAKDSYRCVAGLQVDENIITDAHDRGTETMTLKDIMAKSSNVGMSLIAQDLGAQKLSQALARYQFTVQTNIDYPGEASSKVSNYKEWSKTQMCNIAFGQGLSVTPIQVVRFYGMIANKGVAAEPHFLLDVLSEDAPRTYGTTSVVVDQDAIDNVIGMLEAVVDEGTAKDAQIDGFKVAGKTGTAEYVDPKTGEYDKDHYHVSFVGFIPRASTELVCYVGVNEAPGEYKTVGTFKDIMTYAIERYGITQE